MPKNNKSTYLKFLISLQAEETQKKMAKLATKNLKNLSQEEINSYTKEIQNSKHQVETYNQILKNIENPEYLKMLGEEFQTIAEFEQFVTKKLPENMTIIQPEQGPTHLLIEDKYPILKGQKNIYTYISDTIENSVKETEYYWRAFQIQESIDFADPKKSLIIEKMRKSLEQLKLSHKIDLTCCIPDGCVDFETIIAKILKQYTGALYKTLNPASTSKDPLILKGIRYIFQTLIKNYRAPIPPVGKPVAQKVTLYRNIPLDKDMLNLYKKDSVIYFTNLTSTSLQNLTPFGNSPGKLCVTFLFELLYYNQQKSNKFYSGLRISDISYYQKEKEVLLFPFQFFRITRINQTSSVTYDIYLEELKRKDIIQKMQQPLCKQTKKKVVFKKQQIKSGLEKIKNKTQKVISDKTITKSQAIIKFKEKLLNISNKEFVVQNKEAKSQSQHKKEELVENILGTILKNESQMKIQKGLVDKISQEAEMLKKQEEVKKKEGLKTKETSKLVQVEKKEKMKEVVQKQSNLKVEEAKQAGTQKKEQLIKKKALEQKKMKTAQQEKEQKQQIVTKITKETKVKMQEKMIEITKKEKQEEQKVQKILNLAESCKNFHELIKKIFDISQKNQAKSSSFVQEIIIEKVISAVTPQEEKKSDQIMKNVQKKINEGLTKFKDFQVKTNVDIQKKQYFMLAIQEAFKSVNQKTIIKESIPNCLYKFYIERLVGDVNKFIYQFYFYEQKASEKQLEQFITKEFQKKFGTSGHYLKQNYEKTSQLTCLNIQTSQSFEELKQIVEKLEKNQMLKLLKSQATAKHQNLIYCDQMIDKRGHKDYIIQNFDMEQRGNQDYHFPNGCLRIGIKVLNIYDNNLWLSMNGSPGEWPVIYTSLETITIETGLYGKPNDNPASKHIYPLISQQAINCSSDFNLLTNYMKKVKVNDEYLYIGFQCRVDPLELQYSMSNKKINYVDKSKGKSIRPYGIIMKPA